ncbi:MAG: Uma2 family endonuclease [bacterium]
MSVKTLMTDEDLLQLPDDGHKYEYVEGELQVSPANLYHEDIAVNLILRLGKVVKKLRWGRLYSSSAGFRMKSGNLLSPDVSLVKNSRLPGGKSPEGFGYFAPDLAVEILSPSDSLAALQTKINEYFENGSEQVWVFDPRKRMATVYSSLTDYEVLNENDILRGGDLLPGFSCALKDLFE